MSDLRCTKCGTEKSYADANIADLHKTCGSTATPQKIERENSYGETEVRYAYPGDEHNWVET